MSGGGCGACKNEMLLLLLLVVVVVVATAAAVVGLVIWGVGSEGGF